MKYRVRRRIKILIYLIALIAIPIILYWLRWTGQPLQSINELTNMQGGITYILDDDHWLSFPINGFTPVIKVLSNASVSAAMPLSEEQFLGYVVEYELLDRSGNIIDSNEYHHRSHILWYFDEGKERIVPNNFYLDESLIPAEGRIMLIKTNHLESTARLRIRLVRTDVEVEQVGVRIYQKEPISIFNIGSAWHRLGPERQVQLAEGNIYPVPLLRSFEKENLMKNRPHPVGPLGVVRSDYQTKLIYLRTNTPIRHINKHIAPAGFRLGPYRNAVIKLTPSQNPLKFEFIPLVETTKNADASINIHWMSDVSADEETVSQPWNNRYFTLLKSFDQGHLILSAPQSLILRVWRLQDDKWIDITPDSLDIYAYLSAGTDGVQYALNATPDADPLRFDLRLMFPENELALNQEATVQFEFFDAKHQSVRRGQLLINAEPSLYDGLGFPLYDRKISEPFKFFVPIPKRAKRIELRSEELVFISAYSRPQNLIPTFHVNLLPEGIQSEKLTKQSRLWFSMRPSNYAQLIGLGYRNLVETQARVSSTALGFSSGDYQWVQHLPLGIWLARHIFLSRDNNVKNLADTAGIYYHEIPVNKLVTVPFVAPVDGAKLESSLLAMQLQPTLQSFTVALNDKVYKFSANQAIQAFQLPVLEPGKSNVKIRAKNDIQFYLNHNTLRTERLLKRMIHRFDKKSLTFEIEKNTAQREVIGFRFYRNAHKNEPTQLQVTLQGRRLEGISVTNHYTVKVRRYHIHPLKDAIVPVLGTNDQFVELTDAAYISLDVDFVPGTVKIKFEHLAGPKGYIAVYQIKPGRKETQSIRRSKVGQ